MVELESENVQRNELKLIQQPLIDDLCLCRFHERSGAKPDEVDSTKREYILECAPAKHVGKLQCKTANYGYLKNHHGATRMTAVNPYIIRMTQHLRRILRLWDMQRFMRPRGRSSVFSHGQWQTTGSGPLG